MKLNETPLRSITRYEGVVIDVRLDLAKLPDGSTALREVVEHPGGVAVLPLEADGTVWCVRQFRYPFGEQLVEIPAGRLEPGEAPEDAARRELKEETGLTADTLTPLGRQYATPGYCGEVLHVYLARGLHRGEAHLDPGEFLNVEMHTLDELVELALTDLLPDVKTAVAVLKTKLLTTAASETKSEQRDE